MLHQCALHTVENLHLSLQRFRQKCPLHIDHFGRVDLYYVGTDANDSQKPSCTDDLGFQ